MFAPRVMKRVHRFVSRDLTFRVSFVELTTHLEELRLKQELKPLVTLGLGRVSMGALLMAAHLKGDQGVGVLIRGDGPLEKLYAEAYHKGSFRAYCPHPSYENLSTGNALYLSEAIGQGTLTVARHQPFQKNPFQGTVELVRGNIEADISHYLLQSQQIRSFISLEVAFDPSHSVRLASGLLIEVMPGVEQSLVESLDAYIKKEEPSLNRLLSYGQSPEQIVQAFIDNHPCVEIPHDFELHYSCHCSKERVLQSLQVWGIEGVKEMLKDQRTEVATCQMCGEKYLISNEDLKNVLNLLMRESMH